MKNFLINVILLCVAIWFVILTLGIFFNDFT